MRGVRILFGGKELASIMDILAQHLVPEEQLLFSTEKIEINPHVSRTMQLAGGRAREGSTITGAMAITDRRIFVVGTQGVFSKKPVLKFEAIYDPGYAKALIEIRKAKNEEVIQQSKDMGMLSRAKFMKEQGYSDTIRILTDVEQQKSLLGGGALVLQIFTLNLSKLGKKGKDVARTIGKVVSWGTFDLDKARFELRIKKPLSTTKLVAESMLGGNVVLYEIMKRYLGRTDATYGPLMDIMQAKAKEIAGFVKELEASAA